MIRRIGRLTQHENSIHFEVQRTVSQRILFALVVGSLVENKTWTMKVVLVLDSFQKGFRLLKDELMGVLVKMWNRPPTSNSRNLVNEFRTQTPCGRIIAINSGVSTLQEMLYFLEFDVAAHKRFPTLFLGMTFILLPSLACMHQCRTSNPCPVGSSKIS